MTAARTARWSNLPPNTDRRSTAWQKAPAYHYRGLWSVGVHRRINGHMCSVETDGYHTTAEEAEREADRMIEAGIEDPE